METRVNGVLFLHVGDNLPHNVSRTLPRDIRINALPIYRVNSMICNLPLKRTASSHRTVIHRSNLPDAVAAYLDNYGPSKTTCWCTGSLGLLARIPRDWKC